MMEVWCEIVVLKWKEEEVWCVFWWVLFGSVFVVEQKIEWGLEV